MEVSNGRKRKEDDAGTWQLGWRKELARARAGRCGLVEIDGVAVRRGIPANFRAQE
jgi:hypothetical protein